MNIHNLAPWNWGRISSRIKDYFQWPEDVDDGELETSLGGPCRDDREDSESQKRKEGS